ncbi:uncharacterized protein RCH25_043181 [Pelodytes ibericus]
MEELLHWLEVRISSSLRPRSDDIKSLLQDYTYRSCLSEFLKNEDVHTLYVYFKHVKTSLAASLSPPEVLQSKCTCFVKLGTAPKLTLENIATNVISVDCTEDPMKYIDMVLHQVYLPLLCNDRVMAGTSFSAEKLIDIVHRFTGNLEVIAGHAEGSIVLPVPSLELLKNTSLSSKHGAVVHIMETTVIGWIRQIKVVLKHEPSAELKRKDPKPGVYDEQDMWRMHIQNLQSISKQLSCAEVQEIVCLLEDARSTYGHSVAAVTQDVKKALSQAEENITFLKTLLHWYKQMKLAKSTEKQKYFLPMLHNLLLVWKHSRYYHQNKIFLNLLRLMSNEVVIIAGSLIGPNILNTPQAYNLLKEALKLCATFRGTYLDVKVKADEINTKQKEENDSQISQKSTGIHGHFKMYEQSQPKFNNKECFSTKQRNEKDVSQELWVDSPWPPHNAICFQILNTFMERCNDVLDLVETMKHFQVLKTVASIGGAGSSSLDAMVQEIWDSYCVAKTTFVNRITDIFTTDRNSPFEKAFFDFRTTIKSLEHQLGRILRSSFDQCPTIASQLRLLEVFEGVSTRDVVKDHLKDKDQQLVSMFIEELTQVNDMYVTKANSPPLHVNMTPTVSKLLWIKGLQARISEPMVKLKSVSPLTLESDLGWKLRHLYTSTEQELERFEDSLTKSWLSTVNKELTDSLKQPLLRASGLKPDNEDYLYKIELNLSSDFLIYLREAEYLVGSPFMMKLPESLETLLKNMDINKFKMLSTSLETVVSKYNEVMKRVSYQEKALFEKKLLKTSEILKDGMSFFTWSMEESADYTELATSFISLDLHTNFSIVTNNYKIITDLAAAWYTADLDIFTCRNPSRTYSMTELIMTQKNMEHELESILIPDGQRIHNLVYQSFLSIGISEASPAWQDYIMGIDDLIFQGLKKVTISSLAALLNTLLDSENITILCIEVELINKEVGFNPPLDKSTSDKSVMENMEEWLKVFLLRGSHIKALSTDVKGGYQVYMSEDEEVLQLIGHILQQVEKGVLECQALLETFHRFAYLWKKDVNVEFQNFLNGKQSKLVKPDVEGITDSLNQSNDSRMKSHCIPLIETEQSFLLPPDPTGQKKHSGPLLEEFDLEISTYKATRDSIQSLSDIQRSNWIQVDFRPIKQVLNAYALKWMWNFTKYLIDQTSTTLRNLDSFLKRTEPQIERISGEERDTGSFMKMMRLFNEVSAKQVEMEMQFTVLQKTVILLGKHEMELPADSEELFQTMPSRWNSMKTKVSLAKQRLGPRIQQEAERVTRDLEQFQHKLDALGSDIETSEVYKSKCTSEEAFMVIENFNIEVQILRNEAKDLKELQELLETTVVDFSILNNCEDLLQKLIVVWQYVDSILKEQDSWKKEVWQNMDTEQLYLRTNQHLQLLQSLPGEVQEWDIYKHTMEAVHIMHLTLPLIEDLSNSAMRTRHWNQLVRQTGGLLHVTAQNLTALTLGDLLGMDLAKHTGEVKITVQRAVRDMTIESSLKNCEEVWLSRTFDLRPHSRVILSKARTEDLASSVSGSHYTKGDMSRNVTTRGGSRRMSRQSDKGIHLSKKVGRGSTLSLYESLKHIEEPGTVMLLKSTDSIFEELEDHQIVLTSMQPHAEAGSFLDEVTKWQKKLQVIETTVQLWLLVQEKWTQLEEVSSTLTFRVALPREAALFADVHHHFCRLMKSVEENPNILQNCMRRGLVSLLEMLNYKLERCQRAVRFHLEQKRLAFPRFFFLSLEDTLNIVCYGYDLDILNGYLGKLFQHVHSLLYQKNEASPEIDCHKILGVRSFFGEELYFIEPLECRGPVENWLPRLVNSIKDSLQHHLWAALEHRKVVITSRKEIHSAGARRVVINNSASKEEIAADRKTSLTSSMKQDVSSIKSGGKEELQCKPESRHWVLNTLSDVAYLFSQVKFSKEFRESFNQSSEHGTARIQGCLKDLTQGIENAAKILNEIPQEDILQHSKRTSKAEREGNEQGDEHGTTSSCGKNVCQEILKAPLSSGDVIKLTNHILLLLYQRDVTAKALCDISPIWELSQPLYYEVSAMDVTVRVGDSEIQYGFEYQGSANHMLITPLTERVFVSIVAAVCTGIDALCIGPQGSGKKSMAQELCLALGKPHFFFNCTKNTDYSILQDICKGLAAAGAWICINGLEHLPQCSLTLLAQLLGQIQSAKHYRKETVTLQLEEIPLNTAGACIAIIKRGFNDSLWLNNHINSGKLPNSLLNCFRTVGVGDISPRFLLEAQLLLKGFSHVASQAQKLSILLDSFAKLYIPNLTGCVSSGNGKHSCSSVTGLNNLLSEASNILKSLQRSHCSQLGQDVVSSEDDHQLVLEDQAVVTAINHCWLPQLSADEAAILKSLVALEWPNTSESLKTLSDDTDIDGLIPAVIATKYGCGQQVPSSEFTEETNVPNAIIKAIEKCHIFPSNTFVSKVSHLVQLALKYQTVVIIGPPGCGKTNCIKTYMETLREEKRVVTDTVFINALQSGQLLGCMDEDLRWIDGLLAKLLRTYCQQSETDNGNQVNILHLDGEMNDHQMELMQNLFCGAETFVFENNECIRISNSIKLFWELETLANVSPSVLSCMGILAMPCTNTDWKLRLKIWIDTHVEDLHHQLQQLTDTFLEPSLQFLHENQILLHQDRNSANKTLRGLVLSEANVAETFCSICTALMQHVPEMMPEDIKKYYIFSTIWSFGGWLDTHERTIFSNWWKQAFRNLTTFPGDGQVWDYHIDTDTRQFVRWHDTLSSYFVSHGQSTASEACVHTVQNEPLLYFSSLLTSTGHPVMLAGEAGCGKSVIAQEVLNSLCSGDVAEMLELRVPINNSTDPRRLWGCLKDRLEWQHGTLHRPTGNKKLLCLLDDLNLAKVDGYGRQSACEFVRQLLDQEKIFDPSSLKWKTIKDIIYLATWNLTTTERVPQERLRLLRHFCVFYCHYPSEDDQLAIFSTILSNHFLQPVTECKAGSVPASHHLQGLLPAIVTVSIELQERLRTVFLRTSQRCHYIFTLRDLAKIFRNVCLSLDGSSTAEKVLRLWRHECDWVYGHRVSSSVDHSRYLLEYTIAAKKVFTNDEQLQIILSPHQPIFSNVVEDDGGLITTVAKQQDTNLSRKNEKTSNQVLDGYQQTFNLVHMDELLAEALREYNKVNPRMNITFYKSAVELLCRLTRNLWSPHGSAHTMLCGEGCLRSSTLLARLAAHLSGFSVVQLGTYNKVDNEEQRARRFKSHLVDCYVKAGLKGQRTLLLLAEEQIDSTALVYMTEFVVFGAVSHLFTSEQQATIANAMRNEITNAGLTYSKESAWKRFLHSVQQNFRWFLIHSSTGPAFYKHCTEFSSLIDAINVYFIPQWSREYLVEHANYYIRELEMVTKEERENICHLLASMHLSIAKHDKLARGSHGNLTNATFENFVQCFVALVKDQNVLINKNHELAKETLGIIAEKRKSHEKLTDDLLHQKIVLEEHKEGTLNILQQIAQDKAVVEQKFQIVHQQLQKIKRFRTLLPEYQLAHEKAQYKCSAILESIKELVCGMDVRALGELRAMQKPDVDMEELMASIIIILKSPNTDLTWAKGAKRQMANIDRFLNELITFSNTNLPQSTLELLESNLKKAQFTPENMEKKCGGNVAASSLLRWLQGAVRYYRILASKVKPLQSKVEEMTIALQEAEQKMTTLQQKKRALILRLSDLERGFEEATVHKNKQQQRTVEISEKLDRAGSLAQLLEDERRKYASVVNAFPDRLSGIPGSTAMAAGLVSYLGAYEHHFRQLMLTVEWPMALKEKGFPLMIDSIDPIRGHRIEFSVTFTCDSLMDNQNDLNNKENIGEDQTEENKDSYTDQEETNTDGLPFPNQFSPIVTEELYGDYIKALLMRIVNKSDIQKWASKDWTPQQMENAAILSFSWQRPVLLIDTCFEGEKWVLEILETSLGRPFSSINLQARQDSSVLAPVEKAILSGCPLILNSYNSKWDDLLMPLIDHCSATGEKNTNEDSSSVVCFNGHRLLCSNQLRLYLASDELEPHFNMEISSGTTMISNNSSEGSLLELLLRRAFEKLQPHLHCQLMKTANIILEHQQRLNELEIQTRDCFNSSTTNSMENTVNIISIFNHKKTISKELEKARSTYTGLLELRDILYPLAHQGAMFYSILKSMQVLAAEYYFSLDFFLKLFDSAILRKAESQEDAVQVSTEEFQSDSLTPAPAPQSHEHDPQLSSAVPQQEEESCETKDTVPIPQGEEISIPVGDHSFSLSSNQIRKLMDQLTEAVYYSLIQSLLPEHSTLACALLFLATQQVENENAFMEKELEFFAQGSGLFDKTERDFITSSINQPSWMSLEIWEDLISLSVISRPLKLVCAQVAENPSVWESWYNSDYVEDGNADGTCNEKDAMEDAIFHIPECGSEAGSLLSDFHKLLVLRAVSPNRFPYAVSHYVTRLLSTFAFEDLLPGIEEMSRLDDKILGILVILPSSNNRASYRGAIMSHRPKLAIASAAKKKNIPLYIVSMNNSNEEEVKAALNDALNQNGWLIIENLHLASKSVLKNLHVSLTYATKMQASHKAERQFCVWLLSEPGASIPQTFLAQLKKVSWHFLLMNQTSRNTLTMDATYIDSLPQLLSSAILSALDQLEENISEKLSGTSDIVQRLCFGICALHGIIQTQKIYPWTGLNHIIDIGPIQLNQAFGAVFSAYSKIKAPSDFAVAVEEGVGAVYINLTLRSEEKAYVQALVHEIVSSSLKQNGLLTINNLTIPFPPADLDSSQYYGWMTDHMPGECSLRKLLLPSCSNRAVSEKLALEFMHGLASLYDAMKTSLQLVKPADTFSGKDSAFLHTSLETISEQLPPLIQIDKIDSPVNRLNNHGAETELQASQHVLLQECRLINTYLGEIKLSISALSKCLLTGLLATTGHLRETAESIRKQEVPKSWLILHYCHTGSNTIASWLQDLHMKHKQLKQWMEKCLMPFSKGERGALTSVNLGGLFNPEALFLALKVEFAVHQRYSLHEVVLQVHVAEYLDYKTDTLEGSPLCVENLVLHGAAWDFKNNHLTESRNSMQTLPFVIVTPTHVKNVKVNDEAIDIYDCPVYVDKKMENCAVTLPLLCIKPARQWHLRRVAIMLNSDLNSPTSGISISSTINGQKSIPTINNRTKTDKSSHSKIFNRASEVKHPVSVQTQQAEAPNSKDFQRHSIGMVIIDSFSSDNAQDSTALRQNFTNDTTIETKDTVLSPSIINETISILDDTELFKGLETSEHQKASLTDTEDGKEIKTKMTEGTELVESESEDASDKAEIGIIREDLIVHTTISDYEPPDNELQHRDNNSNFDEAENKGYKEDFDKKRQNSFEEALHTDNDFETGENHAGYNYGRKNENNNEHKSDNSDDGSHAGADNSVGSREHSVNCQEDEKSQESIGEHEDTDTNIYDRSGILGEESGTDTD